MFLIDAFIKVAFLFFQVWSEKFSSNPKFRKKVVPETGAWISLLLLLSLALMFLLL